MPPQPKPICKRYLVNECAAGDLCRYRHEGVPIRNGPFSDQRPAPKFKSKELDLQNMKKVVNENGATFEKFIFDLNYKGEKAEIQERAAWDGTEKLRKPITNKPKSIGIKSSQKPAPFSVDTLKIRLRTIRD